MRMNHLVRALLLFFTVTFVSSCSDDSSPNCPQISQANAGEDHAVNEGNSFVLEANEPASSETGEWTIVTGEGGELDDATNHLATLTGVLGTEYVLRWTLSSTCSEAISFDEVTITFTCPEHGIENAAGSDQEVVLNETNLAAELPENHTGYWTIISGEGGNIDDEENPNSLFDGVIGEEYTLKWTLTADCGAVTEDEVVIKFGVFNSIDFEDITKGMLQAVESSMSTNSIDLSNDGGVVVPAGSLILFKTNEERFGKMTIDYVLNPGIIKVIINGVVFNDDGSIFSITTHTEVRNSWLCDLDTFNETADGTIADFQLQGVSANLKRLKSENLAKFYLVD